MLDSKQSPELTHASNKNFIDGKLVPCSGTKKFDVINPATEELLGSFLETTDAEIDAAIAACNAAQKDWWKGLSAAERAHALHHVAERIEKMKPMLAEVMTLEMGKPYKESLDEVDWCVHTIRYSAEVGRSDMGRVMQPAVKGHMNYTIKVPLGTIALIMPFNYPMVLLAWEAAAALAGGNAVIVKPSEYTTLTTLVFAEAFSDLPKGLFQVVTGGAAVGSHMVEHPHTHGLAFTGSVPVGQKVAAKAAELMKPALIETSGNDPFIVMPSAPLDVVARGAVFAAFMNCGQICVSGERFYVHEAVYDAFVAKVTELTKRLRVGNGLDKVDMGPLVSEKERTRYEAVLKKAVAEGAKVHYGGGRPAGLGKGWFVDPTILTNCTPEMSIFHNESFGPVMPICKVSSLAEAIALANDSKYGLGATIYTADLREAIRASEEIESGMVWVNAPLLDNDAGPFGGAKLSGLGRQLGPEGIDTFRETKLIMIDPDCSETQDGWWFPYKDEQMFSSR